MGTVIRQSVKTALITYLAFGLGYINTLIFYPLLLTKDQIGLVRLLINAAFFFATLASLGSGNIAYKFFPYFKDHTKRHHGILFFLLALGTAGFTLFLILFLIFREDIIGIYAGNANLLIEYLWYLIPFTFIALYSDIFESYIVIQQKPVVPNFLKEFLVRLLASIGLVLLLLKILDFHNFVIYIIISYAIVLVILISYIKKEGVLFLKPEITIFKSDKVKSMLTFGGFIFMGSASGVIIQNIDSLMLAAYKGLETTGVYTIAFFIAVVIEIPKRSISQSVIPMISEATKNDDIVKLDTIYKKSSLNQLIAGAFLFFLVWFNIENIFHFIPNGQDFISGKWVVFWIGTAKLFDMATGVNQEIIRTSKYYKSDLIFYPFLGVMMIVFNILLIPKYGLNGSAFASALAVFLFNIFRYIYLFIMLKIQPFTLDTVWIILISIPVVILNSILPISSYFWLDALYRSVLIVAVFILPIIFFNISEDITKIYRSVLTKIKKSSH